MGHRSTVLIIIVVSGLLFSILYASQAIRKPFVAMGIETRPALTEDDAINIARDDIEKKVAPMHVDKFVLFTKYYGHQLSLIFIHDNGTLYAINSTNGYAIYHTCAGDTCNLRDVNELLRGHLFYVVDGSWQDSSIRNCSPFIHAVDAKSGEILWSYVGNAEDMACQVQPHDW
ncbi:MAG: hypothetical protein ACREAW_01895 [Nitrososphaera sp.]